MYVKIRLKMVKTLLREYCGLTFKDTPETRQRHATNTPQTRQHHTQHTPGTRHAHARNAHARAANIAPRAKSEPSSSPKAVSWGGASYKRKQVALISGPSTLEVEQLFLITKNDLSGILASLPIFEVSGYIKFLMISEASRVGL